MNEWLFNGIHEIASLVISENNYFSMDSMRTLRLVQGQPDRSARLPSLHHHLL